LEFAHQIPEHITAELERRMRELANE